MRPEPQRNQRKPYNMSEENKTQGLPENACRELKEGESYNPIIPSGRKPKEVTAWSVSIGLVMTVIFSAAAAYLGLKVGQVFEAAIPIAILAVGLTGAFKKSDSLSQNVIIQSIGACSGAVVAGSIFTLPAIYIIGLDVNYFQMVMSSLLGAVLGILFLIPFRKYFVNGASKNFGSWGMTLWRMETTLQYFER